MKGKAKQLLVKVPHSEAFKGILRGDVIQWITEEIFAKRAGTIWRITVKREAGTR